MWCGIAEEQGCIISKHGYDQCAGIAIASLADSSDTTPEPYPAPSQSLVQTRHLHTGPGSPWPIQQSHPLPTILLPLPEQG